MRRASFLPVLSLVLPLAGAAPAAAGAALLQDAATGQLLGSATPAGGDRVLTSRHVVEPVLRRGGAMVLVTDEERHPVRVAALSDRLDLAVLVSARPVPGTTLARAEPPGEGEPVAAAAPSGATLRGVVSRHPWHAAWGPALFVRLPVMFGASGGAVRDRSGHLLGLVTAAVSPDARQMTMLRSATGPASAADEAPLVLVLPIGAALAEARRLDPGCCRERRERAIRPD